MLRISEGSTHKQKSNGVDVNLEEGIHYISRDGPQIHGVTPKVAAASPGDHRAQAHRSNQLQLRNTGRSHTWVEDTHIHTLV